MKGDKKDEEKEKGMKEDLDEEMEVENNVLCNVSRVSTCPDLK